MQLTPHFSLSEFTRSTTAVSRHIDNSLDHSDLADSRIINNLTNLCIHVLEPLREHFRCPIVISSGYRCPALNSAVGGVPNSQHLTGEAADIYLPSKEIGMKWFYWIKANADFDQLIFERKLITHQPTPNIHQPSVTIHYWLHVSCKPDTTRNKHQAFHKVKQ